MLLNVLLKEFALPFRVHLLFLKIEPPRFDLALQRPEKSLPEIGRALHPKDVVIPVIEPENTLGLRDLLDMAQGEDQPLLRR